MRRICKGTSEVLKIGSEVFQEHGKMWVDDLISASKLYVEIRDEVPQVFKDNELRMRFIRGIIEWGMFEKRISFKRLYNKVFDYLSFFEISACKEQYVKDFIVAFKEYCQKRWNRYDIIPDKDFSQIAKIAKKLTKEFKINFYDYIKYNHECWEKIQQPLSVKALIDEDKCRKRLIIYNDIKIKKGIIKKEDYKVEEVKRKWNQILTLGVEKFLEKNKTQGYLSHVAKMYIEDKKSGVDELALKKKYSPEMVQENYEKLGGNIDL